MNKVILIGRTVADPELRYAAGSGTAVCKFTLAITRQFKKDETDFIRCVAFNKAAENITQYITKGRQLAEVLELAVMMLKMELKDTLLM